MFLGEGLPSPAEISSPLSSCINSSSLERADMYSSSESIGLLAVVTGVGGRAWLSDTATEAMILLLGVSAEVIVASAAFRFLVVGGIVAVFKGECLRWVGRQRRVVGG